MALTVYKKVAKVIYYRIRVVVRMGREKRRGESWGGGPGLFLRSDQLIVGGSCFGLSITTNERARRKRQPSVTLPGAQHQLIATY